MSHANLLKEPWFPKSPHPMTGERFIGIADDSSITVDSNKKLVEYWAGPPEKPSAWYIDEDDYVVERTPNELAILTAEYENAYLCWVDAGSPTGPKNVMVTHARGTMRAAFRTASGATAEGFRELPDGEWIWTRTAAKTELCKPESW